MSLISNSDVLLTALRGLVNRGARGPWKLDQFHRFAYAEVWDTRAADTFPGDRADFLRAARLFPARLTNGQFSDPKPARGRQRDRQWKKCNV